MRPQSVFHFSLAVLTLVGLSLASSAVHAELRVFQLAIANKKTGQTRVVMSNLDDIQYPGYYHLTPDETITIQDTWMCRGRSDFSQDPLNKFCANPRAPASAPGAPTAAAAPGSSPSTGTGKP